MRRQGVRPMIVSIRRPEDVPADFPADMLLDIVHPPDDAALTAEIKARRARREIPRPMNRVLAEWPGKLDKHRVYEAAWLAPVLRRAGVRHVHAHFAGLAARTAYWLRQFYGFSYSLTAHANDIFCESELPVTVADLVRDARLVVTETDFSRDWLRERHPAHARKIHRVHNGMALDELPEASPAEAPPRIVSVGRFVEKKGFADLIEACAILRGRGVALECRIVGGGPLEQELRALIARRGVGDCVTLTGPLPQDEVRALLASARVFALACIVERDGGMDNLPTVIAEAMGCALPVVSTRVAGVPEMVVEGETGFLVPENNPDALADALERLLRDPVLAQHLGEAGRLVARERFSVERTVAELQRLLARAQAGWLRRICAG